MTIVLFFFHKMVSHCRDNSCAMVLRPSRNLPHDYVTKKEKIKKRYRRIPLVDFPESPHDVTPADSDCFNGDLPNTVS